MFDTFWHAATGHQPAPPFILVIATAVVALLAVVIKQIWPLTRNAITIAHEGGHAIVAVLVGRRLQGIRLQSDTSGLTVTKGKPTGLGMVLTLVVGYMAPSLIGLGGAALLHIDRIRLVLWIAILLLVPMLLMIRNWYGFLAVVATGGLVFAISWYTAASVQAAFAYAGVWFLLIGGVRPIFELANQRRRGKAQDSDVDQLARLTHIPAVLWLTIYAIIAVGALVFGAVLLDVIGHIRSAVS